MLSSFRVCSQRNIHVLPPTLCGQLCGKLPGMSVSFEPRQAVKAVTREAAAAIRAHLNECEAAQDVTPAAANALRRSGYSALGVPEVWCGEWLGGLGATLSELAWAQEQLGAAGASLALVAAMNAQVLGGAFMARSLPDTLLIRLGRAATDEGALINALASEPELGSPSRGGLPQTTLTPDAQGYALSGHKTWATGARALRFGIVTARQEGQVMRVLVDMTAPGVRIASTWGGSLALRGSGSQDVYFDAVRVQASDIVPPTTATPVHSAWFWTALAGTYLGVGTAALEALSGYTNQRVPTALGRPLSSLPRVRETAGRIHAELSAARLLLREAALSFEAEPTQAHLPLLAAAKAICTNAAVAASDQAARVVGGAALAPDLPFERLLRDARAGLTHPPTDAEAYERLGAAVLDAAGQRG